MMTVRARCSSLCADRIVASLPGDAACTCEGEISGRAHHGVTVRLNSAICLSTMACTSSGVFSGGASFSSSHHATDGEKAREMGVDATRPPRAARRSDAVRWSIAYDDQEVRLEAMCREVSGRPCACLRLSSGSQDTWPRDATEFVCATGSDDKVGACCAGSYRTSYVIHVHVA